MSEQTKDTELRESFGGDIGILTKGRNDTDAKIINELLDNEEYGTLLHMFSDEYFKYPTLQNLDGYLINSRLLLGIIHFPRDKENGSATKGLSHRAMSLHGKGAPLITEADPHNTNLSVGEKGPGWTVYDFKERNVPDTQY